MRSVRLVVLSIACAAGVAYADEPRAQWHTNDSVYAGVPFELDLVVAGFDESPQPEAPKLEIAGATVKVIGVEAEQTGMQLTINGRQQMTGGLQWYARYRVEPAKQGTLHVPATTIKQGNNHATARAVDAEVAEVSSTDAMKIELGVPTRPVYVGENVPVTVTWLFRAQPQSDPTFEVPMLDGDAFAIGTRPTSQRRRTFKFTGRDKVVELPFDVDQTDVGGTQYNRLVATFYAAPKKPGKIAIAPTSVVAALPVGRPDFFGRSASRLFRAADATRTLEVKPLPETDRPAGFAGAVGTQFSIAASTSRSVVQLGEPVELAITIKSDQRLDTLALGKLDREGGLPKDRFTVPAEAPTGELSDDGKTKTFKVTAQVTGPANEIPALGFSYFDPVKGTYQTVHSDPIAVSVKGGVVVGAGDVVAASPTKSKPAAGGDADLALVGADLALSAPGDSGGGLGAALWPIVGLLYLIPLALLVARTWQLRTRGQREEAAEVRAARKRVEQELAQAAKTPARDAAGPLAAALRAYARALGRELDDQGLLARLETESFAPSAAASPLSADVRVGVESLVRRWASPKRAAAGKLTAVGALLAIALAPATARADTLEDGRAAYQDALGLSDASAKRAAFARAAAQLGEAARTEPDRAELLADWGNASLGAGDVATATLAFRRALALDASNMRARRNLAWLRSRQPDALRPGGDSASDTLFFFHQWPRARRLVVGAFAFAFAVLLVVPWGGRRRRGLVGLALLPLVVWIAMGASLLLEDHHRDDAIVMDAVVLRAADAAGAPAASSEPLPRGAEVTIVERRDAWTRVRLASGAAGWVQAGAIEPVATR